VPDGGRFGGGFGRLGGLCIAFGVVFGLGRAIRLFGCDLRLLCAPTGLCISLSAATAATSAAPVRVGPV
jgi:hypothetical protein